MRRTSRHLGRRTTGLAAGLLAVSLLAAGCGGTKAGEKQEKIEGAITITKDKLTLKAGDMTFVFGYKLDPKTTPAGIDMHIIEPEAFKDGKAKGIVKLADGKVTLCYHPMGGDRPKEFKSTKENGHHLFVVKKKDAKPGEKK